jgi:hypothetical protein
MNKVVLAVSLAVAQLLAVNAIAQSKGEADPAQSKAAPAAPATKAEKAAAKEQRKATGKEVSKTATMSDEKDNASKGTAKSATKEQKADAKATRKVSAADSVKKGEIPKGEAGPTK